MKEFNGTILMVSHDRYLLNRVVDHLLVVETDRFRVVDGNYDTYCLLVEKGLAGEPAAASNDQSDLSATVETKPKRNRDKPAKRKRRFPYRKVEEIEADIFQQETEIDSLHEQLADPEVLRDGERVKAIQLDVTRCQERLQELYEHWEEASELN